MQNLYEASFESVKTCPVKGLAFLISLNGLAYYDYAAYCANRNIPGAVEIYQDLKQFFVKGHPDTSQGDSTDKLFGQTKILRLKILKKRIPTRSEGVRIRSRCVWTRFKTYPDTS